jgi:NADH-quinone oxidoreductase subunit C
MPDPAGLELIRQDVNKAHPDAIVDTSFDRGQAALIADPRQILDVLRWLRDTPGQEYRFLSSLHCADYLPAEPRFGIHYEMLNMARVERVRVKAMLPGPAASNGGPADGADPGSADLGLRPRTARPSDSLAEQLPGIDSCVDLFPTAEFHEREVYDFFGIEFRGHPDLRRILLPEDYVGWPLRRDFPIGGEPVLFTHNEPDSPGWYE